MLTIAIVLIVAGLILAIASAAGKGGPLALAVAVILALIVEALQYFPAK